ncbi:MAG: hypothetical protein C4523_08810 [Myxococcales bacterium]|nr:MAG: hypothetical protein C4523_08810 [Myxococcales bacterium]
MNRVELKARIDEIASLLSELEWEYSECLSALAALDSAKPSSGLTIEPCPVLPDSTKRPFLTMVNTDGSRKTFFCGGRNVMKTRQEQRASLVEAHRALKPVADALLRRATDAYADGHIDDAAADAFRFGQVVQAARTLMEVYAATDDDTFPIEDGLVLPPALVLLPR